MVLSLPGRPVSVSWAFWTWKKLRLCEPGDLPESQTGGRMRRKTLCLLRGQRPTEACTSSLSLNERTWKVPQARTPGPPSHLGCQSPHRHFYFLLFLTGGISGVITSSSTGSYWHTHLSSATRAQKGRRQQPCLLCAVALAAGAWSPQPGHWGACGWVQTGLQITHLGDKGLRATSTKKLDGALVKG